MSRRLDSPAVLDEDERTRHARVMTDRASSKRSVPSLRLLRGPFRARGSDDAHVPDEYADEYVRRALAAMKAAPARRWTVAALARVAGLSRAPFARRFRRATGTSPLRWLTAHRLEIAQQRLVTSDVTLAAIAAEVGYATEFALSKAFKRLFGIAPGVLRRGLSAGVVSGTRFRAAA
jgi:transcriptional regulator GlxA family with amidase domain